MSPSLRPLRRLTIPLVVVPCVLLAPGQNANAQEPVRLPGVVIKAAPLPPGPRLLAGVVRDTNASTVNEVEITIPALKRRTLTRDDGTFRFDSIPRGTYAVRARKVGYAPQIRTIEVDSLGGIGEFELLRLARALPPVVTSAARGGLSGIVADTSYVGVPLAAVSVLGKSMRTETDSDGTFLLPLTEGSYMVRIAKEGFKDRLVSVTIPSDSGRRISAFLQPFNGKLPVREHWNIPDFGSRQAGRNKQTTGFFTREDMKRIGIEWVYDAVRMTGPRLGATETFSEDCKVIVDGGPTTTDLRALTVEDVEAVEIYKSASLSPTRRAGSAPRSTSMATRGVMSLVPITNAEPAIIENMARYCPVVYVWMR